MRKAIDPLHARLSRHDEPSIDPAFLEWRRFYYDRSTKYADLGLHKFEGDTYMDWYQGGGYGYDPVHQRSWLLRNTQIADFRGTCLDVGSGDGFWTVLLAEWYHVTGVDPSPAGIELANAIKKRLPAKIAPRVDYLLGDALEIDGSYDAVFCRAPSFLNYPPLGGWTEEMLDSKRSNYGLFLEGRDPATAAQKLREYPSFNVVPHPYAHKFRWCLERMLSLTKMLFLFVMSTEPRFYGKYYGDTYAHDPATIAKVFGDYGKVTVRVVDGYIVAEIVKSEN